ncbi:hypothetical protein ACF0H5_013834 [Mactra antiquata]
MNRLHLFLGIVAINLLTVVIVSSEYLNQPSPLKAENISFHTAENDMINEGFISYHIDPQFLGGYNNEYSMFQDPKSDQKRRDTFVTWKRNRRVWNDFIQRTRNKRIFLEGIPNRKIVSSYEMGMFPYNNVVKVSAGCTGTLLTPKHVLTAAHCVHDGKKFKAKMEMLKVEVADRVGYRIHYIVKINVPVLWLKTQTLPEIGRGAFDYAVLQLNLPVSGREKFMPLSLPTIKSLNSNLEFLGFKLGRSPNLWLSECDADESMLIMRGNVALRKCESAYGNSGAAAFASNHVEGTKIIGVLSNIVTTTEGQFSQPSTEYEAIMLLTLPKCLDICAMIHPEGDKYDVCKTVRRNNGAYLEVGSNRIMPFFG